MKAKHLFTIALLQLAMLTTAQDSDKAKPTGYVSINGGSSVPLGEYSDVYIGGASTGSNFNVAYSIPFLFKNHMGLATNFSTCSYGASDQPFIEQQRSLLESVGYQYGTDFTFKSRSGDVSYTQYRILIGMYSTIPLKKRLSIDSRILFGVNFVDRPAFVIYFDDKADNYTATYKQYSTNSTAFAYDLGIGVRYNLGKKQRLCITVNFDYVGSTASFDVKSKAIYKDNNGLSDEGMKTVTQSYSVSSFNTTVGFGYVFGNK